VTGNVGVIMLLSDLEISRSVLTFHLPTVIVVTALAAYFLYKGKLKRWHGFPPRRALRRRLLADRDRRLRWRSDQWLSPVSSRNWSRRQRCHGRDDRIAGTSEVVGTGDGDRPIETASNRSVAFRRDRNRKLSTSVV